MKKIYIVGETKTMATNVLCNFSLKFKDYISKRTKDKIILKDNTILVASSYNEKHDGERDYKTVNAKNFIEICYKYYAKDLKNKTDKTLDLIFQYSQLDGSHHKAWVIDQIVRILTEDEYKAWIYKFMFGDKDPVDAVNSGEYYEWDEGIAP